MAKRPVSRIVIASARGTFEHAQRIVLTQDLFDLSSAQFTVGDDASVRDLAAMLAPGEEFSVLLDGLPQMTGRAEVNETPISADSGTLVEVTCRTKMADAHYSSARTGLSFRDVSIRDFLLAAWAPLGFTLDDFNFAPATDVNLMTGKAKGQPDPTDLEPMKVDQAKVNPPETIRELTDRTLKPHHLLCWDGADRRVCIGRPNVSGPIRYRFQCKRGPAAVGNNVLDVRRAVDWSEVPSEIQTFGSTTGRDITKASIRGFSADLDLLEVAARTGHFNRLVTLPAQHAKTLVHATAQALRERQARSRRKNAWEVTIDDWSYWDGSTLTPFVINTMAEIDVDTASSTASGRYMVARCVRTLDAENGAVTQLALMHPDTLVL